MTERILETYLSAGLLELNGQDAWFDHITTAADQLTKYIAANPAELTDFVYSAIDPSDREDDPARAKVSETLKSVWKTYASVSMGSPATIQKGIILDAVFQNADRDPQIKLAVALLFSSTLPYIDLGSEATVLQPILNQQIQDIEEEAEIRWSVPASVQLPDVPKMEPPSLSGQLKSTNFDSEELEAGLRNAAGPSDATESNAYWPNNNQSWASGFAKIGAESISNTIKEVAGARRVSLKTDKLVEMIGEVVESYIKTVAEQLTTASHGVELRSRLLWWKEAKVSPTARVEYRSLSPLTASALMAFDFQKMLPALAPVSVIAFLREAVRSIANEDHHASLADCLKELSKSKVLGPYQSLDQALKNNGTGVQPFTNLIINGVSGSENIHQSTLFNSKKELSPSELSVLLFTELQAYKAVNEVEAIETTDEEALNTEEQDQDLTEDNA